MRAISRSPQETQKIAAGLARRITQKAVGKKASVLALVGELGAGKTTFVQGFARALGVRAVVRSPTFLLIKSYKLKASSYKLLYHVDCYRIAGAEKLRPLDFKTLLDDPENIILIEWAERIPRALPKHLTTVHIDHIGEHTRKLTITRS